jgi:hypothetical protein
MKVFRTICLVVGLAVGGVVQAADAPKANLNKTMVTQVNPQGLALWEITNAAIDQNGDLAASKLTAASWAKLLKIGSALQRAGQSLAASPGITAALPGTKLQDEENPGSAKAADVQRYLDAQPEEFRKHALDLKKTGEDVVQTAKKHDVKHLAVIAEALDGVCESCHLIFWYPKPKAQ